MVGPWGNDRGGARTAATEEIPMNTLELDTQLNALIIARKTDEAFDRFYAEDVVAQENDERERVGREPWKKGRAELEKGMRKFHAEVRANTASGDVSFSEWVYDVEVEGM